MAVRATKRAARAESGRGPWSTVQVADITEINRMTISRWLDSGKVREPRRDPKSGEFQWTQSDVDELVRYAKSQEKEAQS
jgi:predicted site-specific integrase-resolvase